MTKKTDKERIAALESIIISAVDLLKEQGLAAAGTMNALLAYQVLGDIAAQAEAYDVPPADIGLDGFDVDELLRRPSKTA